MKHTKGPWSFREAYDRGEPCGYVVGGEFENVADVPIGSFGPDETLANAHLISAAPELLEALGGLVVGLMRDYPCVAMGMNDWEPIVQARAAIARAKS